MTCPAITEHVNEKITKRVVERMKQPIKWQWRLFTVHKKGTDNLRIIVDLSHLNKLIHCPTFKMLTLKKVKMLLPLDHFTASLDQKDGYWHIPITPKKRPYLGFEYQNTRYQFRAMPFGLFFNASTMVLGHKSIIPSYIWASSGDSIFHHPIFYW